jgi:tetratricopeptide (TPR) repeat protein
MTSYASVVTLSIMTRITSTNSKKGGAAALSEVEVFVRAERWNEACRAITADLRSDPRNHWLVSRLALTFYEQRRYNDALIHSERALELNPRCPLSLWDYAGTLQMLDRDIEAADIYRRLLRRGAKRIANGPCGEGLARARGLIADCHLRLSDSLRRLNRESEAEIHFAKHLDLRGPGCQSIYSLKDLSKRHGTSLEPHGVVIPREPHE